MRIAEFGMRNGIQIIMVMGLSTLCAAVNTVAAERTLTRSEILTIADKEAQRVGYNVEGWGVSVDVYNSTWTRYAELSGKGVKGDIIRQIEAQMDGRSAWVWAVSYLSPLIRSRSDLWFVRIY